MGGGSPAIRNTSGNVIQPASSRITRPAPRIPKRTAAQLPQARRPTLLPLCQPRLREHFFVFPGRRLRRRTTIEQTRVSFASHSEVAVVGRACLALHRDRLWDGESRRSFKEMVGMERRSWRCRTATSIRSPSSPLISTISPEEYQTTGSDSRVDRPHTAGQAGSGTRRLVSRGRPWPVEAAA
jgi:hypothetical protein